ncbi:hypothetical protein L207DRAFT_423857 [Hyaloscypha variabilis F]|uniref:Acyltransferase 3 domain-containing protein n=1 Tax=Hyaloscypha variabilis (strain UAMH 11265 / GT02V1 / F) TaxID=1149755 RepID=A0A2J6RYA9_HYAVF|nr:hypothetical protein L207DRAFT_423857 [Hyaloscypha variabilis F]
MSGWTSEVLLRLEEGITADQKTHLCSVEEELQAATLIQKFLNYPPRGTCKIHSTSWLDGLRGIAALEVYIFPTTSIWAIIYPTFHSSPAETNPLQFPLIRTFVASAPAAVSLFFVISGYVLTQRSFRSIREHFPEKVYPAVASSMFRRGFRLYTLPIILTFCEMLATRIGITPRLSFTFVLEKSLELQFVNWLHEINRFMNPLYNFSGAIQGLVTYMKYDTAIWTIPLEYYGSLLCYILLLLLAQAPADLQRMAIVAIILAFFMLLGSWHFSCFTVGMLIVDFNLHQESTSTTKGPPKHGIHWVALFAAAFYVAGLPTFALGDAHLKPMPGFETVRWLTPSWLHMEDHARFAWSLSGIALLLSISQLPRLKAVLETDFCQYLGKISFSLYLIHLFCLVLFGLKLQAFLMYLVGVEPHDLVGGGVYDDTLRYVLVCGVWYVLNTALAFALAAQVERWVDRPSVRFAKWLDEKCLKPFLP